MQNFRLLLTVTVVMLSFLSGLHQTNAAGECNCEEGVFCNDSDCAIFIRVFATCGVDDYILGPGEKKTVPIPSGVTCCINSVIIRPYLCATQSFNILANSCEEVDLPAPYGVAIVEKCGVTITAE